MTSSFRFSRTRALASALVCAGAWTAATGCTTESKTGTASLTDASAPSSDGAAADGGDASAVDVTDAGARDGGSSAANGVDAGGGQALDAGVKLGTTSTDDKPERPALGKSTPFDRVLVKPKAGFDVDAIKALVERKTGAKLALVRRTAGKWLLLQFAPTAKGRTENEQAKLVDVLKGMDDFASVEGDRLMKVKQP